MSVDTAKLPSRYESLWAPPPLRRYEVGNGVIVSHFAMLLLLSRWFGSFRSVPFCVVPAKKSISPRREFWKVQLSFLSKLEQVKGFIDIIDGNSGLTSTGLLLIEYLRFCCLPEFWLKICSHRKIMFMFKSE